MWRFCKYLAYLFVALLGGLCLFYVVSVSYVTAMIFAPALFPGHVSKFSRTWMIDESYDRSDPNLKLSPWGMTYDSECGMIRLVVLEMDCLEPARRCQKMINVFEKEKEMVLRNEKDKKIQEEKFHNISRQCFDAATCMKHMACKEGDYHFNKFHKHSHNFFMNHSSFPMCMAKFYHAVKYESFHNCTSDFQFFSKDPFVRNHAFYNGRNCFLSFAHNFCEAQIFNYLLGSYEYFLELAMIPTTDGCGIYEKVMSLECQESMEYFKNSVEVLILGNQTKEEYKEVGKSCDDMHKCFDKLTTACAIPSKFISRTKEYCEKMRFLSSPFWQCLHRLKTENLQPDLLKYPCLIAHNFSDDSTACRRLRDSSECVREFMKDQCGLESVDTYEYSRDYLLEMWDC